MIRSIKSFQNPSKSKRSFCFSSSPIGIILCDKDLPCKYSITIIPPPSAGGLVCARSRCRVCDQTASSRGPQGSRRCAGRLCRRDAWDASQRPVGARTRRPRSPTRAEVGSPCTHSSTPAARDAPVCERPTRRDVYRTSPAEPMSVPTIRKRQGPYHTRRWDCCRASRRGLRRCCNPQAPRGPSPLRPP